MTAYADAMLAAKVRAAADAAWERGLKDICTRLHDVAREIEALDRTEWPADD